MQITLRERADRLLTRQLSNSVFSWQEILRMLLPFVLDSISVMLILMLTTVLISQAGDTSVAAVNLVSPISALIVCLLNGIGAGGTVAVTQACGLGDPRRVRQAAGHILWLIVLAGTAFCLPFLLFPRAVIQGLYPTAETVVIDKAAEYLAGTAVSILVFTIYTGVFCILRGLGESKRCLTLTIIINVSYLLFSILFINVLDLDIRGSVLALLLARILGSASGIVIMFLWKAPIRMQVSDFFSFDRGLLRAILRVSVPFGLEQIFLYGGNIIAEMYMVPLGTGAITTHAVANSLLGTLYAAALGAGNLAVTVVGRCVGADRMEEAYDCGKKMVGISVILLALSAAVFYPILPVLLELYRPKPEVYALAQKLMLYSLPCVLLLWPISNIMPYTLRAASDTVFPSVVSLISMWAIRIGLGYYLAITRGMGLMGIWAAMWAEWGLRSAVLYLRFRSKKWLHASTVAG